MVLARVGPWKTGECLETCQVHRQSSAQNKRSTKRYAGKNHPAPTGISNLDSITSILHHFCYLDAAMFSSSQRAHSSLLFLPLHIGSP